MPIKITINAGNKPARKLALVIGISKYDNVRVLKQPSNDAKDMSNVLKSMQFNVTEKLDLNYTDMVKTCKDFTQQIKLGDLVLFYFSGHGTQSQVSIKIHFYAVPLFHYISNALFFIFIEFQLSVTKKF